MGNGHMTGGVWQGGQQRKLTPQELIVARLINRMKADGMLIPGAPDWLILAPTTRAMEFKRPATRTLLGRAPKGRLSEAQVAFNAKLDKAGIQHVEVYSWDECRGYLVEWGLLPSTWGAQGEPPASRRGTAPATLSRGRDTDPNELFR